ncbi:hypothetical protein HMPREF0819_0798 [Streptococcus equinus ATCC 9812]|uniref:Uncharacterized protein n=1 Tax=Streptococcus equinus ATCC 9812 TaxID=525379 RepID=E8JP75_STREI|nr:hypothetical protein HMPREF0819_0798 [Streptococcus equinus ATCC 9812]
MVPKPQTAHATHGLSFRAVLFRMVPKPVHLHHLVEQSFRAVLFRMVPKLIKFKNDCGYSVLELCCFEWFQNLLTRLISRLISFRAVLFRMVPKPHKSLCHKCL